MDESYDFLLSQSDGTVDTAVRALLPFYAMCIELLSRIGPWLFVLSVGVSLFFIAFSMSSTAELREKIKAGCVAGLLLLPVSTQSSLGLGPLIMWKMTATIDSLFRSGVDNVMRQMTGSGGLPLGFIREMDASLSQNLNDSQLGKIYENYIYSCTAAVDLNEADVNAWRWAGLAGGGGLGVKHSQAVTRETTDADTFISAIPFVGPVYANLMIGKYGLLTQQKVAELRASEGDVARTLAKHPLDGKFEQTSSGMMVPTASYWRAKFRNESVTGEPYVTSISPRYWQVEDVESGASQRDPEKMRLFFAQNCQELYEIADMAMANYVDAIEAHYGELGEKFEITSDSADELLHASGAAVSASMKNFYLNSDATRRITGNTMTPVGAIDDAAAGALGKGFGWMHQLFQFVQEFNLDKGLPTVIGMMSLGIAIIVCFFPFCVLVSLVLPAPGEVIRSLFKIVVLLQLTVCFSYVLATIGIRLQEAANYVGAVGGLNPLGASTSVGNLVMGLNTMLMFFPILAGRMAYALVYGDKGVQAPGSDPARATHQAGTAAAAAMLAKQAAAPLAAAGSALLSAGGKAVSPGGAPAGLPAVQPNSPRPGGGDGFRDVKFAGRSGTDVATRQPSGTFSSPQTFIGNSKTNGKTNGKTLARPQLDKPE